MKLFAIITIAACLTGCGKKLVVDKPARDEIVGVWECSEFPSKFLGEAGGPVGTQKSRIVFRDDGTCTASHFPQRTPYRFTDIVNSSWQITDPSMTPSGIWSVEFEGNFLKCLRAGADLELRFTISAMDHYTVDYKRVEPVSGNGGER